MIEKHNTVLSILLEELNVKHSITYLNYLFTTNPNRNNLYGLISMASHYGITMRGVKIIETSALPKIKTPFVGVLKDSFCVVTSLCNNRIKYRIDNQHIEESIPSFEQKFSGQVAIVVSSHNANEPNLFDNRLNDFQKVFIPLLFFMSVSTLLTSSVISCARINTRWLIYALCNCFGLLVSSFLFEKQCSGRSKIGDKICSIMSSSSCSHVTPTLFERILGIRWESIGIGYFVSNTILETLLAGSFNLLLTNILLIPYSIWALFYQGTNKSGPCLLCIIVQICLLIMGICSFSEIKHIQESLIDWKYIAATSLYAIFVLGAHLYLKWKSKTNESLECNSSFRDIKYNKIVSNALLPKQKHVETSIASSILFNNPNSNHIVTIVSNPFCKPCAEAHRIIESMIIRGLNITVQYVFTSSDKNTKKASEFLANIYLSLSTDDSRSIFSKWFNEDNHRKQLIEKYSSTLTNAQASALEINRQAEWINYNKIKTTPSIFIDGYNLPDYYGVEDIEHFLFE